MNELTPEQRRARGTKVRASRAKIPEIGAQMPVTPRDLTGGQRKTWRLLVSLLRGRGTLTAGDGPLIRSYCEIEERRQKAQAALGAEGLVVSATVLDRNGAPFTKTRPNDHLAIVEQCEKLLHTMRRDLGLTPLVRDRVKRLVIEEQPGESTALRLLRMEKEHASR